MKRKIIALPCLDALSPTLESTALKLMEETGELAQVIGKYRGMSGEPDHLEQQKVVDLIVEELVDVAQTAVTMMFVMEDNYQVDIEAALQRHVKKMFKRGYMKANPEEMANFLNMGPEEIDK
jgi:NTP pyrophosphatase (non-canonical NTP hydrolase)